MNPILLSYLKTCGLKTEASTEEALEFLGKLTGDQKTIATQLSAAPAPAPAPAPVADPTQAAVINAMAAAPGVTAEQIGKIVADQLAAANLPNQLAALAQEHGLAEAMPGWAARMLEAKVTLAEATTMAKELAKTIKETPALSIRVTADRNGDTLAAGISDALCLAAGGKIEKPSERAAEFKGQRIFELGRSYLRALGVPHVYNLSRVEVAELLMIKDRLRNVAPAAFQLSQSVGDFDYVLEASMGKTLRRSYEEIPATWPKWARRETAPDFKDIKRVALSEAPNLSLLPEGGEIEYGYLGDGREVYCLARYASGIGFTFEALVNDDMGAFGRVPQMQGSSAKRLEDIIAYGILTANAALADSVALFATATHVNLSSSSDALSVTSLGAARAAMMVQKGPKGLAPLNLMPRVLIVPAAKLTIAEQLIASTVDPAKNNAAANPFSGRLEIVGHGILDATSTTAWYLAASSDQIDTVEVCFLAGAETPRLVQDVKVDTGNKKFSVTHVMGAKAIDYRGLYKNPGA